MGYILTIYSQSAYKDYLLPAVLNANYSIALYKELFHLSEDATLELENVNGDWRILDNHASELVYTDGRKNAFSQKLRDKDIYSLSLPAGEKITIIVTVSDEFFHVFDKFSLNSVESITIGVAAGNTIRYDFMHVVSDTHAAILRRGNDYIVEDRSKNGLFVNAKRVAGSKKLEYGDLINIFGLSIVYLGDVLAIDTAAENFRFQKPLPAFDSRKTASVPGTPGTSHVFRRSPRYLPKLADDTVKIEAPPAPKEGSQEPMILTIGPSVTMAIPMVLGCAIAIWASGESSGVFMYTGLITAVSSALIGTIWALVNIRHTKKKLREDELKRFEVYGEYLISCANQVQEKYNRNTEILRQLYTDSAACCQYSLSTPQLWNRNLSHEDFLLHRLGTGDIPFQVTVDIPQERFSMLNDALSTKSRMIKENYAMLREVPVCVDLGHKLIGVIGGRGKRGCYPVLYNLTAQVAASNCYTDVKLAFIYDSTKNEGRWDFARWLPHIWSEDKRVRYAAGNQTDASDIFYEIAKVLRMRAEMEPDLGRETFKPHYVLFIEDVSILEGELIAKYLLDDSDLGVTVVLLAENYEELPNTCGYIIENTARFQGMYAVTDPIEDRQTIHFDKVSARQLEKFSRTLSSIQVNEIETGGELPASLTFFDMYGVRRLHELNVEERWRKNRTYESIKGLLGQKSGGAPCFLDVHEKYHGPHGLIAGTTGSGKSETLQTYILSLAINYSPDDVGFFVIDYKGGGMANLFSGLPHLIGQISNLSGNQVHRAMVSIKSENNRRMRIFNEHDVNNINSYTQLYKNGEAAVPIPHMFIIIDEFAELKREEPDFMKELISVAQVGRSLGVHLILATQKPSGTVDDNIWSNAKFRLCLRVQDRQDSKDMLHRPEAAYITQAGRCYLQVGNDELFELFQSGWSGAAYEANEDNLPSNIAMMLSATGKAALVGSHTKIKRRKEEYIKWLNALLDILDEAAGSKESILACAEDSVRQEKLAEQFFEAAEQTDEIDYPRSDYNLLRAEDLIKAYAAAIQQGWNTVEERAELAGRAASEKGWKLPEEKKQTQLEAVVEYLSGLAQENGYVHNLQLWLPVLPEKLYLEDLQGYCQNAFDGQNWPQPSPQWELEAFVGLCDDPVNQAQMPMLLDFANNGHHAIFGTVVSGKSTFLTTLIYSLVMRYTPRALNIYALDFSSKMLLAFEGLKHVGGILSENDEEKIAKFLTMLSSILEERKQMLRGGSFQQYVQTVDNAGLPAIVVAIDNYSAFREKTDGVYDDFMLKLSKEGVNCGIFLVITAMGFSPNEIPSRMGENIRTVVCLEMNDKFAYCDALRTMHLDVLPEENIKGRGLAKSGESFLEFQTALPLKADDDFNRTKQIQEVCAQLNACWTGQQARRIPEIPEKPVWKDFSQLKETRSMQKQGDRLPIGYNHADASVYGIDLRQNYCYLISGKARTGKTNLLREMILSAAGMKTELVVIDFSQELTAVLKGVKARQITTDRELLAFMIELQKIMIERNQFKHTCVDNGDTDEEIFEKMSRKFPRIMIMAGDLTELVQHTENPSDGVEIMAPSLSNMLDKGANHNIFWFACMNSDDHARVSGQSVYDLFVRGRAGIHFGGCVEEQRVLDFEYIKFTDRSKPVKPGIGMLPQRDGEQARRVIIPLCRR